MDNDKILWEQIAQDNESAFRAIYNRYFSDLSIYASKFTKETDLIEDCIQQLFIDLWNKRKSIRIEQSIKAYLYVSLRRSVVKKIQKKEKTLSLDFKSDLYLEQKSRQEELISIETKIEESDKLKNAIKQLSARQEEAIFLKFYKKLEYPEIAAIMNIKIPATYKLISSGLQRLKENM